MASIPLSVLVPDPNAPPRLAAGLQEMAIQRQAAARAAALAPGQLQLQQQAIQQGQQDTQAGQQQNQMRALQLQDEMKVRQLEQKFVTRDDDGKPTGYDWAGFANAATGAGVSPTTVNAIRQAQLKTQTDALSLTEKQRQNEQALNTHAYNSLESIRGVNDPHQRQALYSNALVAATKMGNDLSTWPTQAPDDKGLDQIEAGLGIHAQALADAKTRSDTSKANADAAKAKADANLANKQADLAGTVTPVIRFEQNQENYRAMLARQATQANQRQNQGIQSLQKQADTYSQFLSTANSLKQSLNAARNGNEMAAAVAPLQGTLFVTTSEGVKRINQTELAGVEGAGSLVQRINGALGKQKGKGPLSDDLKNDMGKLVDLYTAAKYSTYANQALYSQKLHGLDPTVTPILNQDGSPGLLGGGAPGASTSGYTRIKASDGSLHDIPTANLGKARQRDPRLQVIQ